MIMEKWPNNRGFTSYRNTLGISHRPHEISLDARKKERTNKVSMHAHAALKDNGHKQAEVEPNKNCSLSKWKSPRPMHEERETTTLTIIVAGIYVVVANSVETQGHNNSEPVHRSIEQANATTIPMNDTCAHEGWDVACNVVQGNNRGGISTSRWSWWRALPRKTRVANVAREK